jgi:hypothetical protein
MYKLACCQGMRNDVRPGRDMRDAFDFAFVAAACFLRQSSAAITPPRGGLHSGNRAGHLRKHLQECLCSNDWMVLEPSIASYGTPLATSLYSAWARLDNLGRCADAAAVAGNGWVCVGEYVRARVRACGTVRKIQLRMMAQGRALVALGDGALGARFKSTQLWLGLGRKLYYGERR